MSWRPKFKDFMTPQGWEWWFRAALMPFYRFPSVGPTYPHGAPELWFDLVEPS